MPRREYIVSSGVQLKRGVGGLVGVVKISVERLCGQGGVKVEGCRIGAGRQSASARVWESSQTS